MNKNNRLVAWGIILSIGLAFLNAWEVFGPANENTYSIAGLGMIGFGIWGVDRKSTRLNSSHIQKSRMPSSA